MHCSCGCKTPTTLPVLNTETFPVSAILGHRTYPGTNFLASTDHTFASVQNQAKTLLRPSPGVAPATGLRTTDEGPHVGRHDPNVTAEPRRTTIGTQRFRPSGCPLRSTLGHLAGVSGPPPLPTLPLYGPSGEASPSLHSSPAPE